MWKTILDKINGGILAFWSQLLWFVLGALLGAMLLGGLVSCTTVETTWNGVKDTPGYVPTSTGVVLPTIFEPPNVHLNVRETANARRTVAG